MQTYRTWNDLKNLNGIVKKTNHKNPYKETTEEYYMVEYVCSLENINILKDNQHFHCIKILELFTKNSIMASVDPWYVYSLFPKAIWLARAAGCIQIQKIKDKKSPELNQRLQFACFFESGMINLIKNENFRNQLDKMPNLERKNALIKVLKLADNFLNNFYIPYLYKKENEIIIKNINFSDFKKLDSLPIQNWNFPSTSDISLNTRGLFHN